MDREWSLLHANPLLPEFNLPTKEERHMQNRNVQLRAEYRKNDDRSLSLHPEFKKMKKRTTRSGQLTGSYLLPTNGIFSLGNWNWTVQFTGKILPFCSLVHNGINAEYLYRIPFSSALSSTLLQTRV
jgi:hypothetical protein